MTTQIRFATIFTILGVALSVQGQLHRGQMVCKGRLDLQPTASADLDNGEIGTRATARSADIWYQAVNESESYITPQNGAKISETSQARRGFAGCQAARYNGDRLALTHLKPGSYLCVMTEQGRLTEIQVDGVYPKYPVLAPKIMTISFAYSTWQN
jgi:hypothetical protein